MLKQAEGPRKIQDTIGEALAAVPLSPNQWTLLSVIAALAAGAVIAVRQDLGLGIILFAIAALLDLVDGAVARARRETSALGGFLDGVADRFVEAIFLFSFMFYPLPIILMDPKIWLAAFIFLGTCMPSFIRAYADHKGVITRERALALGGLFERSERLGLVILGLAAGMLLSMQFFVYAVILACALSLVTIIQRLAAIAQPKV
ncbi:MAG: CDP-alcohol phosphatidyltransferase family protein [Candidatus ainarchaeum sp.]|nr:CDP-alcohol phosphatidyltransferase family protein [Candidatus ainarchaeum sp.]